MVIWDSYMIIIIISKNMIYDNNMIIIISKKQCFAPVLFIRKKFYKNLNSFYEQNMK